MSFVIQCLWTQMRNWLDRCLLSVSGACLKEMGRFQHYIYSWFPAGMFLLPLLFMLK